MLANNNGRNIGWFKIVSKNPVVRELNMKKYDQYRTMTILIGSELKPYDGSAIRIMTKRTDPDALARFLYAASKVFHLLRTDPKCSILDFAGSKKSELLCDSQDFLIEDDSDTFFVYKGDPWAEASPEVRHHYEHEVGDQARTCGDLFIFINPETQKATINFSLTPTTATHYAETRGTGDTDIDHENRLVHALCNYYEYFQTLVEAPYNVEWAGFSNNVDWSNVLQKFRNVF